MIHSLNTNKIIKDSAEKSNLFFTVSLLLLKTAKTGLIILLNFTIFSYISVCFDDGSNGSRTYFRFLSFFFKSFSSSCMDFWIFIKTAAAGIFILIAEILEFLLKET